MSEKNNILGETHNEETSENSFYFSDFLRGFFKFWWVCVAFAAILAGLAFYRGYVKFVPNYHVSCTFAINTESSSSVYESSYNAAVAKEMASSFSSFIETNILQNLICNELGLDYIDAEFSATIVSDTNMVVLSADGVNAKRTYDIMNSTIRNYPKIASYAFGNANIVMITEPTVPTTPTNEGEYKSTTYKAAGIGVIIGFAWIFLYVFFRRTVRTRKDIREKLKLTNLGVLPQVVFKKYNREIDRTILLTNPIIGSGFLEGLRVLRNTVLHSLNKRDKVIVITSTAPSEGKSTVAVNLAASLAENGKKVLMIDGDIRNPSVCKILGTEIKFENKDETYKTIYDEATNLSVITFNPANKRRQWRIMRVEFLKQFVDNFRDQYDYIVFDTPPCGLISDASIIAQVADAAIYVIFQDVVRLSRINNSLNNFRASGVKLIGAVLNGAASGASGYGENYGYKYNSYYRYKIYNRYYRYGYYGSRYSSYSNNREKKNNKK